ncbi:reverse transcriptase [Trichonephila clavipes]|nr:reverse transcriptase [Trichonephila clavipes]
MECERERERVMWIKIGLFCFNLTLRERAKEILRFKLRKLRKYCGQMGNSVGPIPRHLRRAEAVACFRLTTGHNFFGVYLHWLGLAADEACPLCGCARRDGDHLLQWTGLDEYPTDDISDGTGRLSVKWSRSQERTLNK